MEAFRQRLTEARKGMGWDQRSLATALRMSDKTISNLEKEGSPDWPAAQDVIDFMRAYEIEFSENFTSIENWPDLGRRFFLTLDFRFEANQDEQVHDITRRMRVVGMSLVRRLNQAKMTASSYDGVELHSPPINRRSFDTVLAGFIEARKPHLSVNCIVRHRDDFPLTVKEIEDKKLWERGPRHVSLEPSSRQKFPLPAKRKARAATERCCALSPSTTSRHSPPLGQHRPQGSTC